MSGELYGRRFRLKIKCDSQLNKENEVDVIVVEQNGFDPETVRIEFDINYPGVKGWYFSEIIVYNLSPEYRNKIYDEGSIVTLEAGYVGEGNMGKIFEGFLFQTLFEREGVVNYKLTLRCMDGNRIFTEATMFDASIVQGTNQITKLNDFLSKNKKSIPLATGALEEMNSYLEGSEAGGLLRGETVFKSAESYLTEIFNWRGLNKKSGYRIYSHFSKIGIANDSDNNAPPDVANKIVISPSSGLIGTPRQTMYGCDFTMLLNPKVILKRPACVIQLKGVGFQQMKAVYGQTPVPTAGLGLNLEDNSIMEFQVIGVRHVGDSRGDQWYTYVTGMNLAGATPIEPVMYTRWLK